MRYADFADTPAGRLVPTVYDAQAFVPHPLPPDYELSEIALALGDARDAIGELRGACRKLVNPYILIRPLQRLEARTTSAMEGTFTTNDALARAEAGLARDPSADDIEASNYIRALAGSVEALDSLPISGRLLKQAHLRLMQGVPRERGRHAQQGEYARDQNMIGGTRIDNARFIPPPPTETEAAMADLERFINRAEKSPQTALIDIALVHYQFETIHPFADGNGRLGRMLITLMAMTEAQLDLPVLYMSPELDTRKEEYIDLLYAVSARGAWADWFNFFFEVMAESCRRTTRTIDEIVALHAAYQEKLRAVSRSTNTSVVLEALFHTPFLDAKAVVQRTGVTDAAARNILRQLTDLNIVVELDTYPKLWCAPEILRISEARPA